MLCDMRPTALIRLFRLALLTAGLTALNCSVADVSPPAQTISPPTESVVSASLTGPAVSPALPPDWTEKRRRFIAAENAMKAKDKKTYARLTEGLSDYPLWPYLRYRELSRTLKTHKGPMTPLAVDVRAFLQDYADSPLSTHLRTAWLQQLAYRQDWSNYLQDYQVNNIDDDKVGLRCYYFQAQRSIGNASAAMTGARELWLVGTPHPSGCKALFNWWKTTADFSDDLIWQRFQLVVKAGEKTTALRMQKELPAEFKQRSVLWFDYLRKKPQQILAQPELTNHPDGQILASLAMQQMAIKDPLWLYVRWDDLTRTLPPIDHAIRDEARNRIGRTLAKKNHQKSWEWFESLPPSAVDVELGTAQIRWALRQADWQKVLVAIALTPPEERSPERWRYWQARALDMTGQPEMAHAIYAEVAKERSFYGFLAADRLGLPYQFNDQPLPVPQELMDKLQFDPTIQRMNELAILQREADLQAEWRHAMSRFEPTRQMAIARFTRNWGLNLMAMTTLAQLEEWNDLGLRFPMDYAPWVDDHARKNDLEPAFVFAITRRESIFDPQARSAAGARGLMQIMPATGKWLAKSTNTKWPGSNSLDLPETNIRFGSYYIKYLLDRFDGQAHLAVAAYNAGPGRVRQWSPELCRHAPDVWIETLPYLETREYIAAVLTYIAIYRYRMQLPPVRISRDLGMPTSITTDHRENTQMLSCV